MSEVSGLSERGGTPPEGGPRKPARRGGRIRVAGIWIAGVAGLLLVLWGVSGYLEYIGTHASRSSQSAAGNGAGGGTSDSEGKGQSATQFETSVHVQVKVLDEEGREFALGTALPRQLSLKLVGANGQEYTAPFDRVGVWAIATPSGEYRLPLQQTDLGSWRWKVSCKGMIMDREGGAWILPAVQKGLPLGIELTLY